MRYPKLGHPSYLELAMKRWLWTAGYRHCHQCPDWFGAAGRRRHCKPCARRILNERNARRQAEIAARKPAARPEDWGARANAYFASQVDPTYYSDLRLRSRTPQAAL